MKKSSLSLITVGIYIVLLISVAVLFFYVSETKPTCRILLIIAAFIVLLFAVPVFQLWHRMRDLRAGIPIEDERTRRIEIYAGHYAFRYSLVLWVLVFLSHRFFTQHDNLLLIGLLGPLVIQSLCYVYLKHWGRISAE